jgi:O-antigen ligase
VSERVAALRRLPPSARVRFPVTARLGAYPIAIVIGIVLSIVPVIAAATRHRELSLIAAPLATIAGLMGPLPACAVFIIETAFTSGYKRNLAAPLLHPNELFLAALVIGLAGHALIASWRARAAESALPGGWISARVRALRAGLGPIDYAFFIVFVLFTAVALAYHVARGRPLSLPALAVAFLPLQAYVVYRLARAAARSEEDANRLIRLLLLVAVVVVIIGVLQVTNTFGVRRALRGWFESSHTANVFRHGRMTSTVGTYSGLGSFFVLMLIVLAAAWYRGVHRRLTHPIVFGALAALFLFGMLRSGIWAAWVGLPVGLAVTLGPSGLRALRRRVSRRGLLIGLMVMLLLLLLVAPLFVARAELQFGRGSLIPTTLQYRLNIWRDLFLPAIAQSPILGIGLRIPRGFGWSTQESLYIQWLFQGGLVGTTGWVILMATVAVVVRRIRNVRDRGWLGDAALGALAAILTMGIANAFLFLSVTAEVFWVVVGLAVGVATLSRDAAEGPSAGTGSGPRPVTP